MDERQRQIFEKAYAILDRREADERTHQEWLGRHYDPITDRVDLGEDEEIDQSPPQQQSSEMIYKTYAPAQQRSNSMDPVTAAAWNEWADAKIADALNHQAQWMKNSIAEALVLERLSMREELGLLKAEVEVLRSVVKSNNVETDQEIECRLNGKMQYGRH